MSSVPTPQEFIALLNDAAPVPKRNEAYATLWEQHAAQTKQQAGAHDQTVLVGSVRPIGPNRGGDHRDQGPQRCQ
jgi:hypothetical protein